MDLIKRSDGNLYRIDVTTNEYLLHRPPDSLTIGNLKVALNSSKPILCKVGSIKLIATHVWELIRAMWC